MGVRPLCCSGGGTPRRRRARGQTGKEDPRGKGGRIGKKRGASRLNCGHGKDTRACRPVAEITRLDGREDEHSSSCCWSELNHEAVGGPGTSCNGSEVCMRQAPSQREPAGALQARTHTSREQALRGDRQGHQDSETCSHLIKPTSPPPRTPTPPPAPPLGEGDAWGTTTATCLRRPAAHGTHVCTRNTCLHSFREMGLTHTLLRSSCCQ